MKQDKSYNEHVTGVMTDSLIIILVFVSVCFIDIRLAAFIGVILTIILLNRRFILDYNPGFIKGYHIYHNEKELSVPKGVDVFDLSNVASMQHLYNYSEVIQGILASPTILIIRFSGIIHLTEYELGVLKEVLRRLKKSNITVILSDVNEDVKRQFGQSEIKNEVDSENVFYSISEALQKARRLYRTSCKE